MLDVEVHQKSDPDLKNIRRFYSLGWPTEKQSTLAGLQTKKGPQKKTFDWFRSYSVKSYSLSPRKALFLSLYPVLLSPDLVSTMGIVPEQLF